MRRCALAFALAIGTLGSGSTGALAGGWRDCPCGGYVNYAPAPAYRYYAPPAYYAPPPVYYAPPSYGYYAPPAAYGYYAARPYYGYRAPLYDTYYDGYGYGGWRRW